MKKKNNEYTVHTVVSKKKKKKRGMNTRRTESKQRSNDTHINIHASRIFTHQHFSTYVRERERERELQDGEESGVGQQQSVLV